MYMYMYMYIYIYIYDFIRIQASRPFRALMPVSANKCKYCHVYVCNIWINNNKQIYIYIYIYIYV